MSQTVNFLNDIYSKTTINSILDFAINGRWEIYFLNRLTNVLQPLTMVQLAGIKKFTGINILLETGQTYQLGLVMDQIMKGTFQEVRLFDLIVDKNTLKEIKMEFGEGDKDR